MGDRALQFSIANARQFYLAGILKFNDFIYHRKASGQQCPANIVVLPVRLITREAQQGKLIIRNFSGQVLSQGTVKMEGGKGGDQSSSSTRIMASSSSIIIASLFLQRTMVTLRCRALR